ncbi:hypothetical protein NC652_007497 [Populus alba x Populus x berolinensis]|nr:hypothetical protein NC652_007497 [Populus alba x Populus x berolinensis]
MLLPTPRPSFLFSSVFTSSLHSPRVAASLSKTKRDLPQQTHHPRTDLPFFPRSFPSSPPSSSGFLASSCFLAGIKVQCS